ncbi:PDDEXK nuclease domain-containing protein [Ferruginibacter sp. SUN106]|uniref:PDDEXK nuclease domain-containing protein n=1 Tax=Ferruginibacter sp. SUN106 TaxID=2978348 RepID=UPI003D36A331
MSTLLKSTDYKKWLFELKSTIKQSQVKAAIAVNSQLILLYWNLGREIVEKQEKAKWGTGFIDQLSQDLKAEFPEMGGFSRSNLFATKKFYLFYNQSFEFVPQLAGQIVSPNIPQAAGHLEIGQHLADQNSYPPILQHCLKIPWIHNITIIEKVKDKKEVAFYLTQTVENNWSRAVLEMQIESDLYNRQGKAINNFKSTLPEVDSDLANALLKDPYNFDFLNLTAHVKEHELEQKLVDNITRFLLELGKGFAYMGRQFVLSVGGREFKTDLLFYHTKLKCYILIELKVTEFEPEYLGKLNFYLTAIDKLVKEPEDKSTIGILLCKNKNNVVVDFSLQDINKPMGVSEFTYTQLPNNIKQALPTVEEFTQQLNQADEE